MFSIQRLVLNLKITNGNILWLFIFLSILKFYVITENIFLKYFNFAKSKFLKLIGLCLNKILN